MEQLLHLFWRAPDSIAVQPSQPSFDSSAHYADQLGSVRLGGLTHRSDLPRALPTPAAGVSVSTGHAHEMLPLVGTGGSSSAGQLSRGQYMSRWNIHAQK